MYAREELADALQHSVLPAVLDASGVVLYDFAAQLVAVDMRIDFGGGDGLVPQHALDGAQVGPSFQQVGGEGVAEGVRTDALGDARFFGKLFNQVEHHDAGDAVAPTRQEEVVFKILLDSPLRVALLQPVGYLLDGAGRYGHQPLLAAFALHPDEAFVEVEVGDFQVAQFRYAQAAAVERLQDGAVALPLVGAQVDGVYDAVYLLHAQHFGQAETYLGALQQFAGVTLQVVGKDQEVEERLDARQDARLRAGVDADVVQPGGKALQVFQRGAEQVDVFGFEEAQQFVQVRQVGILRVGRERFLQFQVLFVLSDY